MASATVEYLGTIDRNSTLKRQGAKSMTRTEHLWPTRRTWARYTLVACVVLRTSCEAGSRNIELYIEYTGGLWSFARHINYGAYTIGRAGYVQKLSR